MRPFLDLARKTILVLIAVSVVACGGSGDEYEGFDDEITLSTPNRFLTFFCSGFLPAKTA